MRYIFLTAALSLLTLTTPITALSFPLLGLSAGDPSPFSPLARNWARGDTKVALPKPLPNVNDVDKRSSGASVASRSHDGNGDGGSGIPTKHRVISNICDTNADLDFGKCYRQVKKEVEKSEEGYCKAVEGNLKACKSAKEGAKRDCAKEEQASAVCKGVTYSTYAYCLTYGYSGLTSTTRCANTELSLLHDGDISRPLMAIRAPVPVAGSEPNVDAAIASLPYYTNNSIAYTGTSGFRVGTGVSSTPTAGAAGRNGSYVTPTLTASTTGNKTLPTYSSINLPGYTAPTIVSSLQAGTIPSDVPISNSSITSGVSGTATSTGPSYSEGNRVGVFTTDGNVCTRYTGVATVLL